MRSHLLRFVSAGLVLAASLAAQDSSTSKGFYTEHDLATDAQDMHLVNAWGLAFLPGGPWWVNANATGLSLLFNGQGAPQSLIVPVPPASGTGTGSPTGIVANSTTDFQLASGKPALFLFATLDGTISGWDLGVSSAVIKVTAANKVYTGLTMGKISGQNVLYAANTLGSIDVYTSTFQPMTLAAGAFQDPMVPAGFAPYNVQNLGGDIFVTWSNGGPGAGAGYVDEFTPEGTLVLRLEHGDWMNAPWGLAKAPLFGFGIGFGPMSGRLLVGNLGSGQIASFNAKSGKFEGMLNNSNGQPITISGLWGIGFGNGLGAGPADALYFAAGPQGYQHGLFGNITFTKQ